MSNREIAINIINEIPEYKLSYVIDILNGIKNLIVEEVEPDEWDLKMIAEAEAENDGTTYSIEEVLEECGLKYEKIICID